MFTSDASTLLSLLFTKTFAIFQLTVPGTNISWFALFSGCLITVFVIKLISMFIGIPLSLSAPSLHDSIKHNRSNREVNK